uniref:Uncharacterized protein n=1 Tax=Arundo donax TaxID=35708 RepID=A0A0A9DWU6_ARUDO
MPSWMLCSNCRTKDRAILRKVFCASYMTSRNGLLPENNTCIHSMPQITTVIFYRLVHIKTIIISCWNLKVM